MATGPGVAALTTQPEAPSTTEPSVETSDPIVANFALVELSPASNKPVGEAAHVDGVFGDRDSGATVWAEVIVNNRWIFSDSGTINDGELRVPLTYA